MSQPVLRLGMNGSAVTLLQQRLSAKGFHVKADGDFGEKTEDAVEQFQASCGLSADGIVGSLTWTLLMAEGQAATPEDVIAQARLALQAKVSVNAHPQANVVLRAAIGALGTREVPDGSNGGPELAEIVEGPGGDGVVPSAYYLYWKVTDKAVLKGMPPWCALFVCWATRKGLSLTSWKDLPWGDWFGAVSQIEDWAKKSQGHWILPSSTKAEAGWLFTISREKSGSDTATNTGAGHIGFVVCDNGDGTVTTIEGNTSNKVSSLTRKKSDFRGFIKWW